MKLIKPKEEIFFDAPICKQLKNEVDLVITINQ